MFCYQCEQTQNGTGCISVGVCAKGPETAALQDLLVYASLGLAHVGRRAPLDVASKTAVVAHLRNALFATVTNVNFDDEALARMIADIVDRRDALRQTLGAGPFPPSVTFDLPRDRADQLRLADEIGIDARKARLGEDLVSLQELVTYGLKGLAAYAHHGAELGYEEASVNDFLLDGLDALNDPAPDLDGLVALTLRCGQASLKTLELLDAANTGVFGHPEPTPVPMGVRKGKCILVSGHDLADLKALLDQTEGRGINVYTHGEMLPAHGYPGLKKYAHLAGHYGGAWMRQKKEFPAFPGPIVMTTNCLMQPSPDYGDRLFNRGVVGWPGIHHLPDRDFSAVIDSALASPGFERDDDAPRTHWAGFGHKSVTDIAGTVVEAVRDGQIKHFLLIGGCDGAKPGRNYFTDMAEGAPQDWAILTLGCGKFRLTDLDLGTIAGLPRLLDMGQCNDAWSAIRVAQALADAFETDVNGLPLSLVLSWYEQKAVTVLLALLSLGVRNIRLGPSLPAFLSPAVLTVLVDRFGIKPVAETAEIDLAAIQSGR